MYRANAIVLSVILVGVTFAHLAAQDRGHFSSWEEVPAIIDSITEKDYRKQLERLHELTWIKLGYPQVSMCLSPEDHQRYMLQAKQRWQDWWKSTGQPVSIQKEKDAKVDQEALAKALKFHNSKENPHAIPPVWVPAEWTLYVTFSNGDYMGREKEIWVIDRQTENVSFTKLRGDHKKGSWLWHLVLTKYNDLTPVQADQLFKALCYVHHFAPAEKADTPDDTLAGLYYPHSTLRLRDGKDGILWNTEGYEFSKSVPEFGNGVSGRSYFFLRSMFSDAKKWKEITKPTTEQLAPYRKLLSVSKPYLDAGFAGEIVKLFGNQGGKLERQALLDWAEKQKMATNPALDWKVCVGDFGTGAKVNIINFTGLQIQQTLTEIKKISVRLEKNPAGRSDSKEAKAKEEELERYVADLLAAEKKAKEDELASYPQPLRTLMIADEHPDDSDLKHLSAAVQAIRDAPDPDLFKQLIHEMKDDGTLKMRSLMKYILLNESKLLKLKPWKDRQEAIAIGACIDQLTSAGEARDELIEIILYACGGGRVEIEGEHGGRAISVTVLENGSQLRIGSASNPLSLKAVQQQLRRLYAESKLGRK